MSMKALPAAEMIDIYEVWVDGQCWLVTPSGAFIQKPVYYLEPPFKIMKLEATADDR